jgi:Dyp-type peroxidase family
MSSPQFGVITPNVQGANPIDQPNPVPEHLVLAAFDFVGSDRSPRQILDALSTLVGHELAGQLGGVDPPAETGELGFVDGYDRKALTITLGISAAGYARLGWAEGDRPADLRPIPWAKLGDDPELAASGDLLLVISSDDLFVCEHVVRRVENELGTDLALVWTQVGAQRYDSAESQALGDTGRSLIGFRDGTINLRPRENDEDAKLVLIDPDAVGTYPAHPSSTDDGPRYPDDLAPVPEHEPEWTRNGTYLAVRVSVFDTAAWDRLSRVQQQHAVGRFKVSGASLDLTDDPNRVGEPPAFGSDPAAAGVALTAHIRKAFAYCKVRAWYRHFYTILCPRAGGLQRGLASLAFGRTFSTQFEFVLRAQMRNPDFPTRGAGTDELLTLLANQVVCGGYYYLPAITDIARPSDWVLPDTV